jgi:hypothetical protein
VGAFQKLLLLLQIGCMGVTKERASELLRLLNGSRGGGEQRVHRVGGFQGAQETLRMMSVQRLEGQVKVSKAR